MSDFTASTLNDETEAHRLVGMFLQSFAQMEQALDAGIAKLLSLEGGRDDIVCSSIPFAKKLGVFFSAEDLLAEMPDTERKKFLTDTRSEILELNNKRIMFAHNPFSSNAGDGLSFRRVVADKKLSVSTVILKSKEVEDLSASAKKLAQQIENLIKEMKPYTPSLDFSDSRNSMYAAAIL